MSDHFLLYLDQTTTPECKLVYQEAIETLSKAGIADHVFYIDQMMEQDDLGDAGDFLASVSKLLSDAIYALMLQFGVTLAPETPLSYSVDILKATLAMDNWSDPAALSNACESDEGIEVAFATCLEVTGSYHASDYLPYLSRVSVDLLQRIDELNQVFADSALPSEEEHSRAKLRLTAFLERVAAPILSQAIGEMLLIGGPYKALIEPYEEKISQLDMESAVNELVGFALASELPNDALETAIQDESQGWWADNASAAIKVQQLVRARLKDANLP